MYLSVAAENPIQDWDDSTIGIAKKSGRVVDFVPIPGPKSTAHSRCAPSQGDAQPTVAARKVPAYRAQRCQPQPMASMPLRWPMSAERPCCRRLIRLAR
jgi:hypothetical protein